MSSENFKVEATTGREEWTGNHGPMITYRLAVNGGEEVDLNQRPETPAPAVGDEIWGHLEDGKYRPRLKKDPKDGGSWSERSSGGGSGGEDKIGVQWAVGRANERFMAGLISEDEVERVAADLLAMRDRVAASGVGEVKGASQHQNPPASEQNGPAIHQRLASLLEAAGVNPAAATVIGDFVVDPGRGFTPAEQDAALHALGQPNLQAGAVKRLTERTEEATGEPVPSEPAEDSIPF